MTKWLRIVDRIRTASRAKLENGAECTVARTSTCRCGSTAGLVETGLSPHTARTRVPGSACETSMLASETKACSPVM